MEQRVNIDSETYSTRSGYVVAIEVLGSDSPEQQVHQGFNWFKSVWSIPTTPKIQVFIWKAIQGALPTGDNLRKRGLLQHTTYIHCGGAGTTEYLFLHFPFAKLVWSVVPLKLQFDPDLFSSFVSALEAASWTWLPPCGISGDVFSWICWNKWTTRNKLLFESRSPSHTSTVTKAITEACEWTLAQSPTTSIQKSSPLQIT